MGSKNAKESTEGNKKIGYLPITSVVGYNVDYVPYYGTVLPVKTPRTGVVAVPVKIDENAKSSTKSSKLKYTDNDVKVKAKWTGSDLKISKKCK